MTTKKIPDLPAAIVPLAGTELFEVVQSGNSAKVAASQIANTATNVRTVPTGGTGASSLTGYVIGNGASAMTASPTIPWAALTGIPHNYGAFYDTTTQSAAANTATVMLLNNTSLVDGVTLSGGSQVGMPVNGIYNIQFSAQFANSGAADVQASVWLRKNGVTDIPVSCTDITVPSKVGSVNGYSVAAWNFLDSFAAGDYIQLMWSVPSTSVVIEAIGTRTAPIRPAAPSLIVTVNQVA